MGKFPIDDAVSSSVFSFAATAATAAAAMTVDAIADTVAAAMAVAPTTTAGIAVTPHIAATARARYFTILCPNTVLNIVRLQVRQSSLLSFQSYLALPILHLISHLPQFILDI